MTIYATVPQRTGARSCPFGRVRCATGGFANLNRRLGVSLARPLSYAQREST